MDFVTEIKHLHTINMRALPQQWPWPEDVNIITCLVPRVLFTSQLVQANWTVLAYLPA